MIQRVLKSVIGMFIGLFLFLLLVGMIKQKIYDTNLKKEYQPTGQFSDIGNNRIHYDYDSSGEITFILISGLGETMETWNTIHKDLKEMGSVFRYDRSGLGFSDEGRLPRSVDILVEELHTVLTNENIKGPYTLIGHSAGAFISRHFANTYPDQVSGLFLIDPYQEMAREHFGEWPLSFKLMNWSLRKMAWSGLPYALLPHPPHPMYKSSKAIRTYGLESYSEALSIDQFEKLKTNSDVPIYIISANNSNPDHNKLFREWNDEILSRYSHPLNKHIIVEGGHHVHIEQPELILSELTQLVSGIKY